MIVVVIVVIYFVMTQSGNFWIHHRIWPIWTSKKIRPTYFL